MNGKNISDQSPYAVAGRICIVEADLLMPHSRTHTRSSMRTHDDCNVITIHTTSP